MQFFKKEDEMEKDQRTEKKLARGGGMERIHGGLQKKEKS
jgi:hypothetical protein